MTTKINGRTLDLLEKSPMESLNDLGLSTWRDGDRAQVIKLNEGIIKGLSKGKVVDNRIC